MDAEIPEAPPPKPEAPPFLPATPLAWRLALGAAVVGLTAIAYFAQSALDSRVLAGMGLLCFFGVALAFSANLRAINWHTVGWGIALQLLLILFVMKLEVFGKRPGYEFFKAAGAVVGKFLDFSDKGASFVFGPLADPGAVDNVFHRGGVFAFKVLPTIVFISSFFTVLYHFGVLQWVVRVFARIMSYLMRTSGAETLSVTANVFMGQTEAPLIVKPYVPRMTQSELLALMVGGMAHISGALLAVYIGMGADKVAILATSVMASPCSLYLAKIVLPELGQPETRGFIKAQVEREHRNVIDAAAAGASDGMRLAINIAAMLIAFLAFIALFDYLLQLISPSLTLAAIFSKLFAPVAVLLGVDGADVPRVANLLGTKLVANEFVAYTEFQQYVQQGLLNDRTQTLVTYALTGFANFSSIGIQLGGIGGMAPTRRADLARLGGRALLTGTLVTLINAALAGLLL
jgi:concentrative nucleoside transporter, CNT family